MSGAEEHDDRFERVASGEAERGENADRERAAAVDPQLAAPPERTRPLDAAAADPIARSVSASKAEPVVEVAPGKTAEVVALRPATPERPATTASAWRRRLVLAAGPLALAAAMIVYVGGQSGPSAPDLPAYTLTAVGPQAKPGAAESTDPAASTRLRLPRGVGRDARFELLLRPATAPQGKVVAYAFTFGGTSSEASPLEAKVEIAPEGSVKLSGSSRAVEGATEIRVVLGAPTAIGKFDDAAARARSASGDAHVLVLTVPIDRE
jgi:hypothetical protein